MEETVFFNLGNAIAAKRDPKELIKEAQIVKDQRKSAGKLVIVEDPVKGEHILFDLSDQEESKETTNAFKIKKIIE
ncbi:hypothetical protein [Candidatus Enterococcus ferrettii]|uniref:Uncharacterized protein n=1 Tax=Candidatus Enterococcus ferrettii TaxID=2815324 RepID=A0ABV0EN43_9ENTE|nr:hypothetical protein [Enterococcus sp. 665A]MBO1340014.1 hypothetical protein [Enterococcus sp. 665A]